MKSRYKRNKPKKRTPWGIFRKHISDPVILAKLKELKKDY